jgi:hypothetical protein
MRYWRRPIAVFLDALVSQGEPVCHRRPLKNGCGDDLMVLHVGHHWTDMEKVLHELWAAQTSLLLLHKPVLFLDLDSEGMNADAQQRLFFETAKRYARKPVAVHCESLDEQDHWVVEMAQAILSPDAVVSEDLLENRLLSKHSPCCSGSVRSARPPRVARSTYFFW